MAQISGISVSVLVGFVIVFLVSGVMGQRAVDRWTRETGRAPMIHKGWGSWHRYLRSVEHEMPASLRKRIAFWNRIGWLALILMLAAIWWAGAERHLK
jgi:hypothetical protein